MRLINLIVAAALVLAAGYVYKLKFAATVEAERVAKIRTEISRERDAIAALRGEAAKLEAPARIQGLADRHLKLKPLDLEQIATIDAVPFPQPDLSPRSADEPAVAAVKSVLATGSIPSGPAASSVLAPGAPASRPAPAAPNQPHPSPSPPRAAAPAAPRQPALPLANPRPAAAPTARAAPAAPTTSIVRRPAPQAYAPAPASTSPFAPPRPPADLLAGSAR